MNNFMMLCGTPLLAVAIIVVLLLLLLAIFDPEGLKTTLFYRLGVGGEKTPPDMDEFIKRHEEEEE